MPFSTIRFEISGRSPSLPVTAVIATWPEMSVPELVMNCFVPSITHSPSSSEARVAAVALPASDPASGSVNPNGEPSFRPAQKIGQKPLFLLIVVMPKTKIGSVPRPVWALTVTATLESTLGELLDRKHELQRGAAGATDRLGEWDPHQPELAERADDLVRKALGAVELPCDRCDFATREVADRLLKQPVVLRQLEVHDASPLSRLQLDEYGTAGNDVAFGGENCGDDSGVRSEQ